MFGNMDYPVEISSSREPSKAESSSSSWINLDSDSSRPGRSGSSISQDMSMKEKLIQLEKTFASLQAQLQTPPSATLKLELVKETVPTEVEKGRWKAWGVFEPQSDPIKQLPWHEDAVQTFKACATEISHPSSQSKRDEPSLWMGKCLKRGKLSQIQCTYFNLKGPPQPCILPE